MCNSAWELDGVAVADPGANLEALGDFAYAAALTVMRFEHQYSRALAHPQLLSQLCVAVASVDPQRSEALDTVTAYLHNGTRRTEAAGYPSDVVLVAVNNAAVVAVACVSPGYSDVVDADGTLVEAAASPARLQAYLLNLSTGLEDTVTDVSYRVADTSAEPADDCSELDAWTDQWHANVQGWIAEGRIWEPMGMIVTATDMCESPPVDGPDECPRDWPQ